MSKSRLRNFNFGKNIELLIILHLNKYNSQSLFDVAKRVEASSDWIKVFCHFHERRRVTPDGETKGGKTWIDLEALKDGYLAPRGWSIPVFPIINTVDNLSAYYTGPGTENISIRRNF